MDAILWSQLSERIDVPILAMMYRGGHHKLVSLYRRAASRKESVGSHTVYKPPRVTRQCASLQVTKRVVGVLRLGGGPLPGAADDCRGRPRSQDVRLVDLGSRAQERRCGAGAGRRRNRQVGQRARGAGHGERGLVQDVALAAGLLEVRLGR